MLDDLYFLPKWNNCLAPRLTHNQGSISTSLTVYYIVLYYHVLYNYNVSHHISAVVTPTKTWKSRSNLLINLDKATEAMRSEVTIQYYMESLTHIWQSWSPHWSFTLRTGVLFTALQVTPPSFPGEFLIVTDRKDSPAPKEYYSHDRCESTCHLNCKLSIPAEQCYINTLTLLGFLKKKYRFSLKLKSTLILE